MRLNPDLVPCPQCHQPTDSLKGYRLPTFLLFIFIAASFKHALVVGCPTCMRTKRLKLGLINLLPANLLWLVLLLPWYSIAAAMTTTPGHSSAVLKALGGDVSRRGPLRLPAQMKWSSDEVPLTGLEVGVVGVCAASREDRPRWFVAMRDGRVRGVDFDDGSVFFEAQAGFAFPGEMRATLAASADGRFLAVVQRTGAQGALYEVPSGRLLTALSREDYHADVSAWPLALVQHGGREVLITSTAWNRLEALELPSLVRLAPQEAESKLDYFWGHLSVSADGRRLASFGWFWHPVGALRFVDVDAWLSTGVDPPGEAFPSQFAEWWDDGVCWLDDGRVAMRGQPTASADEIFETPEGVAVVDLATQMVQRYLPGLNPSEIAFDGTHLLCLRERTWCLSLETGEVKALLERRTDCWHPGARVALTIPQGEQKHFELHWLRGAWGRGVPLPATAGTNELLVLADSLEERGFPRELVSHCRDGHRHGRRCWVLEGLR